jgi:hypothetical protein
METALWFYFLVGPLVALAIGGLVTRWIWIDSRR